MKKFLSLLVCLMLTLGLIGCASGSDDKSADTDKKESSDEATNDELKGHLVIYTSEPQDLVTEMLDDFVSKNPALHTNCIVPVPVMLRLSYLPSWTPVAQMPMFCGLQTWVICMTWTIRV